MTVSLMGDFVWVEVFVGGNVCLGFGFIFACLGL